MRPLTPPPRRTARVASLLGAAGVTAGALLLTLAALRPHFVAVPARTRAPASEQVVYSVARASVTPARPARAPAAIPRERASARRAAGEAPAAGVVSAPTVTTPAAPDTGGAPRAPTPLRRSEVAKAGAAVPVVGSSVAGAAGAPADGAVGLARRSPGPVRFDSALRAVRGELAGALASGRLKPPPLTQAERDVQLRAEALAVIAAHGGPVLLAAPAAGSVGLPLPFGGPSRRQRERDHAVHAETMAIMARVQRRADSVTAARRRADSLTHVADSSHHGPPPRL